MDEDVELGGFRRMVEHPAYARQVEAELNELEAELESLDDEEETYELADVDLDLLSEEQLKTHAALLDLSISSRPRSALRPIAGR